MTISISRSSLEELSHPNYYNSLIEEIDQLPSAGGDHATDARPSPRRARHTRPLKSKSIYMTPMDTTLAHAKDLARLAPPPPPAHRLPDPGPFSLTGGFKTQQAAEISQQLAVTYLNVGGLTATKLLFILAYMKSTKTDVLICSDAIGT